jgi:3-oxoacyl-(acyl-carrier-protein) synthase
VTAVPPAGAGLTVLRRASWPESPDDQAPPPLPGFVYSSFSPLVAAAAERCLTREHASAPADPARGSRTATVLVSRYGDVTSAVLVAEAVDAGRRVAPLLFYQAVPNAVAGYLMARWGLNGPVVCVSPAGDPMAEGLAVAAGLIEDGDADEALIVVAEQAAAGRDGVHSGRDEAEAVLVGTAQVGTAQVGTAQVGAG